LNSQFLLKIQNGRLLPLIPTYHLHTSRILDVHANLASQDNLTSMTIFQIKKESHHHSMITSAVKLKLKLQDFCTWLPYFIVFILKAMHLNHQLILIRTRYLKVPFFRTARRSMFAHKVSVFISATHNFSSHLKGAQAVWRECRF